MSEVFTTKSEFFSDSALLILNIDAPIGSKLFDSKYKLAGAAPGNFAYFELGTNDVLTCCHSL